MGWRMGQLRPAVRNSRIGAAFRAEYGGDGRRMRWIGAYLLFGAAPIARGRQPILGRKAQASGKAR